MNWRGNNAFVNIMMVICGYEHNAYHQLSETTIVKVKEICYLTEIFCLYSALYFQWVDVSKAYTFLKKYLNNDNKYI